MRRVALLLPFLVIACGTLPQPVDIQTNNVIIPVACLKHGLELPPKPNYVDSDAALAAAPDIYDVVKTYKAGRKQRIQHENELYAALAGCSTDAAPVPTDTPVLTPAPAQHWWDHILSPTRGK